MSYTTPAELNAACHKVLRLHHLSCRTKRSYFGYAWTLRQQYKRGRVENDV